MNLFDYKLLLITALIFIPLERLLPLHQGQRIFRRGWQTDVIYLLLNSILIKLGLLAVIIAAISLADFVLPPVFREGVASQPLWLQIAEAVLLSDLGFYFMH